MVSPLATVVAEVRWPFRHGRPFACGLVLARYLTQHVLKWEALIYIAVVLFFLYAARWTYTLKLWLLHGRRLNFACVGRAPPAAVLYQTHRRGCVSQVSNRVWPVLDH